SSFEARAAGPSILRVLPKQDIINTGTVDSTLMHATNSMVSRSRVGSGSLIRWEKNCLETVKERRRKRERRKRKRKRKRTRGSKRKTHSTLQILSTSARQRGNQTHTRYACE